MKKKIFMVMAVSWLIFSFCSCGNNTNTKNVEISEEQVSVGSRNNPYHIGDTIELSNITPYLVGSYEDVSFNLVFTVNNSYSIDEGISIVYDKTLGKNVLKLDKGTGYLKLPQDIWKDAEGGFTVSFKVKPDSDTDSDSRIFQTNLCGYGVGDTVWHDAPEISITPGGSIRVYVGGRTINGTYSPNATYNNGGSGDDKSYAEPGGHKTRYNGAVNALSSEKWTEITISVSSTFENAVY